MAIYDGNITDKNGNIIHPNTCATNVIMPGNTGKNLAQYLDTMVGNRVEIHSTSDILTTQIHTIIMEAKVFQGALDVTSQFKPTQFNWKRESDDSAADTIWNDNHKGRKKITIAESDVKHNSVFICELYSDD